MRRVSILYALYAGLAALTVALVVIWFAFRSHAWASNWLPNFIAESAGIFVTVAVVDGVIRAQRARSERPFRLRAATRLQRALQSMLNLIAADLYYLPNPDKWLNIRRADEFVEGWRTQTDGVPLIWMADWVRRWMLATSQTAEDLDKMRAKYEAVLSPKLADAIDEFVDTFDAATTKGPYHVLGSSHPEHGLYETWLDALKWTDAINANPRDLASYDSEVEADPEYPKNMVREDTLDEQLSEHVDTLMAALYWIAVEFESLAGRPLRTDDALKTQWGIHSLMVAVAETRERRLAGEPPDTGEGEPDA